MEEHDEWLGQERPRSKQVSSPSDSRRGAEFNGWNIFYVHSLSLLGREGGEWTESNSMV